MAARPLVDSWGRVHDNLRISVTDRCNIRCFYCMPETDVHFVRRSEILDFEEIERFVRIAVTLGVRKLRVTGGEPLVRRDLPVLIRRLSAIPGIEDLALTTNGVLLPQLAAAAEFHIIDFVAHHDPQPDAQLASRRHARFTEALLHQFAAIKTPQLWIATHGVYRRFSPKKTQQ